MGSFRGSLSKFRDSRSGSVQQTSQQSGSVSYGWIPLYPQTTLMVRGTYTVFPSSITTRLRFSSPCVRIRKCLVIVAKTATGYMLCMSLISSSTVGYIFLVQTADYPWRNTLSNLAEEIIEGRLLKSLTLSLKVAE